MMKLFYSNISPFVRKVLVTALITGTRDQIELIDLNVDKVFTPTEEFKKKNPLAKVPTLVLDDGDSVIDSTVICEYLNSISKKGSIYPVGNQKAYFLQKKYEAVADGIMEAAVLRRYESLRPKELQSVDFDNKQKSKIELGLQYFEAQATHLATEDFKIGEISIVSCIGYLYLRFAHEDWLARTPALKSWSDNVQSHPLFDKTTTSL